MIARHFNAGNGHHRLSPDGTVETGAAAAACSIQRRRAWGYCFSRPFGTRATGVVVPALKTRGYYQVSHRDRSGQRLGVQGKEGQLGRGMGMGAFRP
jgi:hypothetical protein